MRYMRGHFIVTAPDIEPVSVRRSKLDWVIVRPVILTNGPKTATHRALVDPRGHARRPGRRIRSGKTEGLNEQGRSRDHESSDEDNQTRKQHYVAQEHTHTRLPLHLFCAGRLASAKVMQSPDSRIMKIGKASHSRPARGPGFIKILALLF